MRLIPKYKDGNKTYQFRRYGDVDLPANIRILDERGLEISPNENTKILTDSDGNPINRSWLVANGYHYSPSPGTIYANTPLDEVVVIAKKKEPTTLQNIGQFINDEILLNKDNIRVNNYRRALQRNPNFSQDWDMANNMHDFLNISTGGLVNRLSPTQNIGFAIDAVQGDDLLNSWMGNSGIVSDKFMQEHPWWSAAINIVGDGLSLNGKTITTGLKNGTRNFKPYIEAYNNRNNAFVTHNQHQKYFDKFVKETDLDDFMRKVPTTTGDIVSIAKKDNAMYAIRANPQAVGAEIHLGGMGSGPSTTGKRFAYRAFNNLPSGSYISADSNLPSLTGLVQRDGFWNTIKRNNPFADPKIIKEEIPLTENSYEELLSIGNRSSNKFRLDFAHNYRGNLHLDPASVDKSKQFYKLYHEAIDTKNLTNLNKYLKKMNAPKATFDSNGNIELSMPILYKKRFGGKLE